ncbi:hypothetical protein M409DRAFT_30443 [Zasmidium cellare ATCC 36951]|uniref:Uncharacterized protein n=1 Tax=Zasmidium cellare ATCC 36951 TaxID=1080233 RepID=A0A6A6C020_ZASCE|nr:uncharacterized protein M409DRAFT_30443 [Zasmidium cellare ATCC 36951]KAF2159159.1 hypothetical protein M409DRAFT_30443 [Zasmidium cellare ATCC 36951]
MSVGFRHHFLTGLEDIAKQPQPDKRSSWLSDGPSTAYNAELETKCRQGALSAAERLNQEIRDVVCSPAFAAAVMSKKSSFMDLNCYTDTTGTKKGQGSEYASLRARLARLESSAV